MEKAYLLGIPELDAQHEEIDDIVTSLLEAIESHDRWHLVHYILVRLYEALRIHFAVEESVMRIVAYPEAAKHAGLHRDILEAVAAYRDQTLRRDAIEQIDLKPRDIVATHILDHDKHFAGFLAEHFGITQN